MEGIRYGFRENKKKHIKRDKMTRFKKNYKKKCQNETLYCVKIERR